MNPFSVYINRYNINRYNNFLDSSNLYIGGVFTSLNGDIYGRFLGTYNINGKYFENITDKTTGIYNWSSI